MTPPTPSMVREIGAAFAVLSIYLLTLLVPLHEVSALQRQFAELGYETPGAWSICAAPVASDDDEAEPAAVKCPVTGAGKPALAVPSPVGLLNVLRVVLRAAPVFVETDSLPLRLLRATLHPRAPPLA